MTGHVLLLLDFFVCAVRCLFKVIHDGRKKTSWDIKNSLATFKAHTKKELISDEKNPHKGLKSQVGITTTPLAFKTNK